jgi:hypothetical protein
MAVEPMYPGQKIPLSSKKIAMYARFWRKRQAIKQANRHDVGGKAQQNSSKPTRQRIKTPLEEWPASQYSISMLIVQPGGQAVPGRREQVERSAHCPDPGGAVLCIGLKVI